MAIVVKDEVSNWKDHTRPSFGAYPDWMAQANAALEQIQKNRRGKQLYDEIHEAAKTVSIVRALDGNQANVTWVQGKIHPTYEPLTGVQAVNHALKIAIENKADTSKLKSLIHKLAQSVTWKSDPGLEVSAISLNEVSNQHLLAELEQYECLTPGEGMDCFIRWHPINDYIGDVSLNRQAPENKWRTRPPWIGLAHELVHAWRFVTGRCIFTSSELSDEQLATGVPPYMCGKYTENGIRYYAFQVMRPFYGTTHGK